MYMLKKCMISLLLMQIQKYFDNNNNTSRQKSSLGIYCIASHLTHGLHRESFTLHIYTFAQGLRNHTGYMGVRVLSHTPNMKIENKTWLAKKNYCPHSTIQYIYPPSNSKMVPMSPDCICTYLTCPQVHFFLRGVAQLFQE